MTINLTREDFEQAIKSGASVFEGNTILDTGKPSGRYYRFIRVPLANGEHKVDALYGQRFYGTLENKPVTFNQEIRFLCLVVDNAKTVNETQDFKTILCRSSFTSDSVIEEMAQKLFDMFRENVTEEDKKKILKGSHYDKIARQNAFCRIIKGYKNYRSPIDSIVDEIGNGSCFGLTSTNADELVVDYLANPTGWAERTIEKIKKANSGQHGRLYGITLAVVEELTEEYKPMQLWQDNLNESEDHIRYSTNNLVSPPLALIGETYISDESYFHKWLVAQGGNELLERASITIDVDVIYAYDNVNKVEKSSEDGEVHGVLINSTMYLRESEIKQVARLIKDEKLRNRVLTLMRSHRRIVSAPEKENRSIREIASAQMLGQG